MTPRRASFAALATLGGTLLALAGAELWARVADPRLPAQRIGVSPPLELQGEGEDLFWASPADNQRALDGCPADATGPRLLLQGSSILYGSKVEPWEAPGPRLRAALQARGVVAPCVVNHAQPAATFSTQRAALAADEAAPAAVLLWEL